MRHGLVFHDGFDLGQPKLPQLLRHGLHFAVSFSHQLRERLLNPWIQVFVAIHGYVLTY